MLELPSRRSMIVGFAVVALAAVGFSALKGTSVSQVASYSVQTGWRIPSGDNTSFVYVDSITDPFRVSTFDWQGATAASFALPHFDGVGFPTSVLPIMQTIRSVSPSSDLAITEDDRVIDHTGAVRGQLDKTLGFGAMWANDGAHICELTVSGLATSGKGLPSGDVTLQVIDAAGHVKNSGVVASMASETNPEIKACDSSSDLAVVVEHGTQGTFHLPSIIRVVVMQISTGRVEYQKDFPSGSQPTTLAVSADGRYFAQPNTTGPLTSFQIVGSLDGQIRATITASDFSGFAGDGSQAVIAFRDPNNTGSTDIQLINWQTGAVLWQDPEPGVAGVTGICSYSSVPSVFVAVDEPSGPSLWRVGSDGHGTMVSNSFGQLFGFGPHN